PKDVEKQLEKITPQLMNGGGWGCQPSLGTPDEAKPENIHAMINYMHKHGVYRA
ncbi:MAG: hypothetical protein GY870_13850, partial [archaeon]|nr:hypothetical protein [archaeon]